MPCHPFTLPNGARGFICSRAPCPRCACGQPSAFQCDAPTKRSTCSRHLCAKCATVTGPDTHLCPTHAAQGAPAQGSLELVMPEAKDHSRVTPQGRAMGKSAARLAEQGLQRLQALGLGSVEGPGVRGEMCTTCACRPGSVPNGCLQTQLDFLKAAAEGRPMQGMVATLTAAGAELARLTHTRITRMASSSLVLAGVETMPDGLAHEQEWWCRQVSGGPPRPYDPDPPSAVARDLSYAPWTSPEWMPA